MVQYFNRQSQGPKEGDNEIAESLGDSRTFKKKKKKKHLLTFKNVA